MGCCGQKRALLTRPPAPTGAPAAVVAARPAPAGRAAPAPPGPARPVPARSSASTALQGMVTLRYLERSPILVMGPATGRQYNFSAGDPLQSVDGRDVAALVRTRFFRLD